MGRKTTLGGRYALYRLKADSSLTTAPCSSVFQSLAMKAELKQAPLDSQTVSLKGKPKQQMTSLNYERLNSLS